MTWWEWTLIGGAAWFALSVVLALQLGPVLKRRSEALELEYRTSGEGVAHACADTLT